MARGATRLREQIMGMASTTHARDHALGFCTEQSSPSRRDDDPNAMTQARLSSAGS